MFARGHKWYTYIVDHKLVLPAFLGSAQVCCGHSCVCMTQLVCDSQVGLAVTEVEILWCGAEWHVSSGLWSCSASSCQLSVQLRWISVDAIAKMGILSEWTWRRELASRLKEAGFYSVFYGSLYFHFPYKKAKGRGKKRVIKKSRNDL